MQGYDRYILKELNHFRRKHHYRPYIRWQNVLASTGFFFHYSNANSLLKLLKLEGRDKASSKSVALENMQISDNGEEK